MGYVRLGRMMLDSALWPDRDARDIFIVALLMAERRKYEEPIAGLDPATMEPTGYTVPASTYGFIAAASTGLIRRAGITDKAVGMEAIQRLCYPDDTIADGGYGGRRLVRVDGGFIVPNYKRFWIPAFPAKTRSFSGWKALGELHPEADTINRLSDAERSLYRRVGGGRKRASVDFEFPEAV